MGFFIPNSLQIPTSSQSLLIHSYPSLACYLFNKLFNSIACLLYFINLQLVIPVRTWILLYLGRTMYKCLWVCLALYKCKLIKLGILLTYEFFVVTHRHLLPIQPRLCNLKCILRVFFDESFYSHHVRVGPHEHVA